MKSKYFIFASILLLTGCASSSKSSDSGGGSKLANTLFMGVLCAATPDPASCMKGAADSISGKSSLDSTDERLKKAEKKAQDLEKSLRRQCTFKGGFYNSVTGCSR